MSVPRREYTDNYDLDLYMPCDRPNLRDQYNTAMGKIDCALKGLHDRDILLSNDLAASNSLARQAYDQSIENEAAVDKAHARLNQVEDGLAGKAPIFHASVTKDFGPATTTHYGHVKLTDDYTGNQGVQDGMAVSPRALYNLYIQLESQMNTVNSLYNQLVQDINTPAIPILRYNPANGGIYNVDNCVAYYRHGNVVVDIIDAPIPPSELLGGDSDPTSCTIGYIPMQYAPTKAEASAGACFNSTNSEIWPSDKDTGAHMMTNACILKVHTDGRVVLNCSKVFPTQWNNVSQLGNVQANLIYPVLNANIVNHGTSAFTS